MKVDREEDTCFYLRFLYIFMSHSAKFIYIYMIVSYTIYIVSYTIYIVSYTYMPDSIFSVNIAECVTRS